MQTRGEGRPEFAGIEFEVRGCAPMEAEIRAAWGHDFDGKERAD